MTFIGQPYTGEQPDSQSASTWNKPAVIELFAVTKAFGSVRVLDGVTSRIRLGEITVLMGPSGTRKSVSLLQRRRFAGIGLTA